MCPSLNEAFGCVVRGVSNDVRGCLFGCEEIHAYLSKAPIVQIAASNTRNSVLKHGTHRAIATSTFPDVTRELLVFDQRKGGPGRSREEVGARKICYPFDCGFK